MLICMYIYILHVCVYSTHCIYSYMCDDHICECALHVENTWVHLFIYTVFVYNVCIC